MSYVCTNCGSVITNQQFYEYQKQQSYNKGRNGCIFIILLLLCVTVFLIPIAILLYILINKKENISECPNCHAKNCLIPANTPMARKILKENYTDDEIKKLKERENSGTNQIQSRKTGFMGCIWWIIGLYILALIIGLAANIK